MDKKAIKRTSHKKKKNRNRMQDRHFNKVTICFDSFELM